MNLIDIILDGWEKIPLTEMAFSRKKVREYIENDSVQLIQNWCLIRYSRLTGQCSELVNHWKTELAAVMSKLTSLRITKAGPKQKRSLFSEIWNGFEYSFNEDVVWEVIYRKFRTEKINTNQPVVHQVCSDFVKESEKLIDLMAATKVVPVDDYIESL